MLIKRFLDCTQGWGLGTRRASHVSGGVELSVPPSYLWGGGKEGESIANGQRFNQMYRSLHRNPRTGFRELLGW